MQIRRAVVEDAEKLSALVLSAKAHWGYAREQLEAWRSSLEVSAESISSRPAFVGELEGAIVGFYSLFSSVQVWELDNLWVLPQFVRRGIGRALLMHAAQIAVEGGATSIIIDSDPNAESFYARCGAKRIGAVAAPIAGQPNRVRPQLVLAVTRSNTSVNADPLQRRYAPLSRSGYL